jgi:ribosomal-protein-alanine N-acetyltransferase
VTRHKAEGVRLRPATERDLPGIHGIEAATFADAWSLSGFRDVLDHPHALLEVAESDSGELLGYAAAWFVADESEIANLAVAEPVRRRGVASLLLDRILAEAASFGARSVFLEVRESNEAGRKLYESRGFVASGRRKLYYRKPDEDALIMRRAL